VPVRLPWYRLVAINLFSLSLGMVSNTLEPAVLGHKVLELVPDRKSMALGFTTFAGLIVAVLWQPIIGVFSDRTRSSWGRRAPYFIVGTLLVVACLFMIALAPSFAIVVIGVLAIQVASNTVQGPGQALIPDQVPVEQRGTASGLKAAFEILAFVAGRQISGQLVAAGSVVGAVAVTSAVFGLATLFTLLAARESRDSAASGRQGGVWEALSQTFVVDWKAHPAFVWWFLNRFLFWGGFIALNTFLLFYMIDVVQMQPSEAQRFVGNLSTVIGLVLLLVALSSGWLSDRVGRRPLVAAAGILAAIGTATILVFRSPSLLVGSGAIIGLGVGIFLSANWALVTDIVPEGEAARYLGIANIATAGGSGLARFLGGAMIDPINSLTGSREFGYLTLYALTMIAFLLGTAAILRLPGRA